MSSSLAEVQDHAHEDEFDVLLTHSDRARANLRARGTLDADSAPLLAEIIAGHVRAGRRFIRLDIGCLAFADREALLVVRRAHRLVLDARGTLILTRVTESHRLTFAAGGLERELFIVPLSAHESAAPDGYLPEPDGFFQAPT